MGAVGLIRKGTLVAGRIIDPASPLGGRPTSPGTSAPAAAPRWRARGIRQLALWLLAGYGATAVLGALWRRVAASSTPGPIPSFVAQQLGDELQAARDSATSVVPVTWRPWWTPVPVAGALAATAGRRVMYVGVVPTLLPPPRTAGEPPATEQWSVAFDSVSIREGHSLLTGRRTLLLTGGAHRQRFDVAGADRSVADAMVAALSRWQEAQRLAAEHDRVVREEAAEIARAPVYHRVRRGETLTSVALAYAATVDSLRRINHLTTDRIRAGNVLLIKPQG